MTNAQAFQIDNNYKKSHGKDVNVKYIKCNNINVNINEFELTVLPPLLTGLATEAQATDAGGSSFGNGGSNGLSGSDNKGIVFICINNNNNEQEEPEPTTATLKVTKQINCPDDTQGQDCEDFEELITEDQFLFQVTGNNPDPSSQFPGSPTGTDVTLGPGNYVVSETTDESFQTDIDTFFDTHPDHLIIFSSTFTGDCTQSVAIDEATGTISAGDSETCDIENSFQISSDTTPTTSNLLVTKTVTCEEVEEKSILSIQQEIDPCETLLFTIGEGQFNISVSGNNPVPSAFVDSIGRQNVVLGPGAYTVTETQNILVFLAEQDLKDELSVDVNGPIPSFNEDCDEISQGSFSATGTIGAGASQECEITNLFQIEEVI
ncbi:MAG: hypothetical protein ACM3VV_03865 [Deltaproteobacteria bacterium]